MKRYNQGADESFSAFLERQRNRIRTKLAQDTARGEQWWQTTVTHKTERRLLDMAPLSVGDSEKAPRW